MIIKYWIAGINFGFQIDPSLCRCVRNGNYDEALDLEAFVTKLATMHSR